MIAPVSPLLALTPPPEVVPHAAWSLPFAALLLAIAILPLIPKAAYWWEHHHHKLLVGLTLGAVVLLHYGLRGYGVAGEGRTPPTAPGLPTVVAVVEHAVIQDYAPFLVLLFSLYTVAGGMHLRGTIRPYPHVNTGFLALGAVLASFVGTTGASMLLIAPLIEANRARTRVRHTVVFFILIVSNIGGMLTPLGDPPLFLGYLQGVPFLWTLRLLPQWLLSIGILLAVYFAWDLVAFLREPAEARAESPRGREPIRLHGAINLVWLLGVVLSVALIVPNRNLPGTGIVVGRFVRELVMLGFVAASIATTPRNLKNDAGFTYGAMIEVACLFLGVFLTMRVPMEILQARGATLGLTTPLQFFWACGGLSGVLDNAPTYMVFFETARALPLEGYAGIPLSPGVGEPIRADLLAAISCGAVMMGANTYIGNGPNLMVKSIAEARGVPMPGFFGYMALSLGVLGPVLVLTSWLFFA